MTPVPERPDYSSVPNMAVQFSDVSKKQKMIDKLVLFNLNPLEMRIWRDNIAWVQKENGFVSVEKNNSITQNWVTIDEFLAPFAAIYKEWEEGQTQRQRFDMEAEDLGLIKPTLKVPTEEEIINKCQELYKNGNGQMNNLISLSSWTIDKIIELNK